MTFDVQVVDGIAPSGDEIVLPMSSSSLFVSTHIDYGLRNRGVAQLMISGVLTDQCAESAVRDACDLGYLLTLVTDACASCTDERHNWSLKAISGYFRQLTTDQLMEDLAAR